MTTFAATLFFTASHVAVALVAWYVAHEAQLADLVRAARAISPAAAQLVHQVAAAARAPK